jgi:hypothetical protein
MLFYQKSNQNRNRMQKIATITNREQQAADDRAYWRTKTPQERLAAIEFLRQQYIKLKFGEVNPRFCSVFYNYQSPTKRKISKSALDLFVHTPQKKHHSYPHKK